jgi:hypothetical protein
VTSSSRKTNLSWKRWRQQSSSPSSGLPIHLARQLELRSTYGRDEAVRDILLFLVKEIDALSRSWPPPDDLTECGHLAELAVRDLEPIQLYGVLLEGPPRWRRGKIAEGLVETLPKRLESVLVKALTSELSNMLGRWKRWNVRELETKRKKMVELGRTRLEDPRPPEARVRPTLEELADSRKMNANPYTPPGKT